MQQMSNACAMKRTQSSTSGLHALVQPTSSQPVASVNVSVKVNANCGHAALLQQQHCHCAWAAWVWALPSKY
jgi:hypothetical protein